MGLATMPGNSVSIATYGYFSTTYTRTGGAQKKRRVSGPVPAARGRKGEWSGERLKDPQVSLPLPGSQFMFSRPLFSLSHTHTDAPI